MAPDKRLSSLHNAITPADPDHVIRQRRANRHHCDDNDRWGQESGRPRVFFFIAFDIGHFNCRFGGDHCGWRRMSRHCTNNCKGSRNKKQQHRKSADSAGAGLLHEERR